MAALGDSRADTGRRAGIPQGLTVVIAGFLPILAIVSLFFGGSKAF